MAVEPIDLSNESSELQAVDFGLGAFIAAAFTGYALGVGPKGWQDFLARPIKQKIYRSSGETPYDVARQALKAQSGASSPSAGKTVNDVELPFVYYARRTGLANSIDKRAISGRRFNDELTRQFDLTMLPCQLDYKLGFAAWDKLTIDKLMVAWYAHVAKNSAFYLPYRIKGELFEDIRAAIDDNGTVTLSDESRPLSEGRLYSASTNLTINTNILIGAEVAIVDPVTVIFTQHTLQSDVTGA